MTRRAVAVAVVVALVALGGCSVSVGSSGGVNTDEVEQQLVDAQKQASPDLDVGRAVCPSDVKPEIGSTFECVITVAGVEAPYAVTLTGIDENEERGQFDLRPAKAILATDKVVEFLRGQLDESSTGARVDCGAAKVKVLDVGGTFDCTVSEAGGSQTVILRAEDTEGTVVIAGTR